ncbi:MAG: tetratricopeptide repeat protein, partial [Candidatus Omnitrophota bacterium]
MSIALRLTGFYATVLLCLAPVLSAEAQEKYEGNPWSLGHYIIGSYYDSLGDLEGAVNEYRLAQDADPRNAVLSLGLASIFIRQEKYLLAAEELRKAAGSDPEMGRAHALLSLIYAGVDNSEVDIKEPLQVLERIKDTEPEDIEVYKSLGGLYLKQGKLVQAKDIFQLAVKKGPRNPQAHFFLARAYYKLKDYRFLEKELKEAIRLDPDYADALNFLGYFYLEQNRNINQAGKMIRRALVFEPKNGAYLDSLGWFYYKKKDYKKALIYLQQAASILADPEIYSHLGDTCLKLRNLKDARSNWEKSLELDPH